MQLGCACIIDGPCAMFVSVMTQCPTNQLASVVLDLCRASQFQFWSQSWLGA
jgi:hypothetical protein